MSMNMIVVLLIIYFGLILFHIPFVIYNSFTRRELVKGRIITFSENYDWLLYGKWWIYWLGFYRWIYKRLTIEDLRIRANSGVHDMVNGMETKTYTTIQQRTPTNPQHKFQAFPPHHTENKTQGEKRKPDTQRKRKEKEQTEREERERSECERVRDSFENRAEKKSRREGNPAWAHSPRLHCNSVYVLSIHNY